MAGIRAILGFFPKTSEYENNRIKLEDDYNSLLAFRASKELHRYHELEEYRKSEEFAQKKKDLLALRFNKTDDFQKEKQFKSFSRSSDIRLFLKTSDSGELQRFQQLEKSSTLKKYLELEQFIHSEAYLAAKKEASLSSKEKFRRSDLAKTLDQYNSQTNSSRINAYNKFVKHKLFKEFEAAIAEGLPEKADKLAAEDASSAEYKKLRKSARYKKFQKHSRSPFKKSYDELKGSDEIDAYADLANFISSDEFKRQKKEIESKSFKETDEFHKLQEYESLAKSDDLKFHKKYKKSKALKNYNTLNGSERIKEYESLKKYIASDEFIRFKSYATQSPKKRWQESKEYEKFKEFEALHSSEKIQWYLKNIDSPKFNWHRLWNETFAEKFESKNIDSSKWMTRYYYGDKMLKDSYSLSSDKHFVTDGKNVKIDGSELVITVRKEEVKGKSWHPTMGFVTRDFGYTSGLLSTGKSFRQLCGTFEAKIRISKSPDIMNAFWMVGEKQMPHIDIAKASKKLSFGNIWGNAIDTGGAKKFSKKYKRAKFSGDYFIYTLEWTPGKLTWKINGLEVAATNQGIPEEPLYIVLSAGLHKDMNGSLLPANMDIDWVRCFQRDDLISDKK